MIKQCPIFDLVNSQAPGASPDINWILWTGLVFYPILISIPMSVFFLSLNRILALKFPLDYAHRHQQRLLLIEKACLLLSAVCSLGISQRYSTPLPLGPLRLAATSSPALSLRCGSWLKRASSTSGSATWQWSSYCSG